ncbi:hypothetical protein DYB32_001183 [Aphanomyces invadans]|uniref:Uncharacterized protein n=1 Tax=Aphanomyces invadans TaxID=157072 RepID=A0A418B793_9STRA|nr:hypothetical protein DYB32_001183 [Aphanomyces invadans]
MDMQGELARLDQAASKVALMRASAEQVIQDVCTSTTDLLREVSASIARVDTAWKANRDHIPDTARAAIVDEFAQFLTKSLDVRNSAGLMQLAQAFVQRDTAMVDKFIENSVNVVVFAKAVTEVSVKHEGANTASTTPIRMVRQSDSPVSINTPEENTILKRGHSSDEDNHDSNSTEPKRRRLTLLTPAKSATAASPPPTPSPSAAFVSLTPHANPVVSNDVESFAPTLERTLGKAFANKWLRVVAREPWTEWSNAFVPFLPGLNPGQVAFNQTLRMFFQEHGRAMWERFFFLGTSLHPHNTEPSRRFRRLRGAMGHLVHDLYKLEGVDVFLFLETYPHPFWPIVVQHPIPLDISFPSHSRELLSYFQDQCTKRWPSYQGYWTPPVEATTAQVVEYGFECYDPMAFVGWAAKRTQHSSRQDKWTFAFDKTTDGNYPTNFFATLVAEMAAKRSSFDPAHAPYVSVVQPPKTLPKQWKFPRGPQSLFTWDPTAQRAISMPPPAAERTPLKMARRSSVTPSKYKLRN